MGMWLWLMALMCFHIYICLRTSCNCARALELDYEDHDLSDPVPRRRPGGARADKTDRRGADKRSVNFITVGTATPPRQHVRGSWRQREVRLESPSHCLCRCASLWRPEPERDQREPVPCLRKRHCVRVCRDLIGSHCPAPRVYRACRAGRLTRSACAGCCIRAAREAALTAEVCHASVSHG